MSREQYIKDLIKQNGYTLKDYAGKINIPYSTLLSMLNGSIGGTAIDSVIKICKGLGITINQLQEHDEEGDTFSDTITLTPDESVMIKQYRHLPDTMKEDIHDYISMKYTKATTAATEQEQLA
jgi:repressor LexA